MFPGKTADEIDRRFETRVVVTAGQHDVGVTFAKKSSAARQDVLQAFQRESTTRAWTSASRSSTRSSSKGPLTVAGPGHSPSRERIFSCEPDARCEKPRRVRSRYSRGSRAARIDGRSPTASALGCSSSTAPERAKGRAFEAGVQTALACILVSPQFLFRVEAGSGERRARHRYRIGDLELASRLSFFLWSSMPDDELLDAAVAGELERRPAALEAQVERMLADERATTLVDNFAEPVALPAQPARLGARHRTSSRTSTTTCARRSAARRSCSFESDRARGPAACSIC